jgi:hypothetical protein
MSPGAKQRAEFVGLLVLLELCLERWPRATYGTLTGMAVLEFIAHGPTPAAPRVEAGNLLDGAPANNRP